MPKFLYTYSIIASNWLRYTVAQRCLHNSSIFSHTLAAAVELGLYNGRFSFVHWCSSLDTDKMRISLNLVGFNEGQRMREIAFILCYPSKN